MIPKVRRMYSSTKVISAIYSVVYTWTNDVTADICTCQLQLPRRNYRPRALIMHRWLPVDGHKLVCDRRRYLVERFLYIFHRDPNRNREAPVRERNRMGCRFVRPAVFLCADRCLLRCRRSDWLSPLARVLDKLLLFLVTFSS